MRSPHIFSRTGVGRCMSFRLVGGSMLFLTVCHLMGCGGDSDVEGDLTPEETTPSPTPDPTGTLAVSFAMNVDWNTVMDEPAVGTFYGAIYASEDVDNGTGPSPDAVSLEGLQLAVDLTQNEGESVVLYTTGALLVGEVYILGFLDSDANANPENLFPDAGDLVTVPGDNDFDVVGGIDTPVQVYFDLILN